MSDQQKIFRRYSLRLNLWMLLGCSILATACSRPDATVIEPENDEQLELMKAMVAGETDAVDQADESR
ncbi:MAG: hypothetical protein AAF802_17175 [Planctomycetota bacterium]